MREEVTEEIIALQETVIACLVEQLGGEARIPRACLEQPPNIEQSDDPITGDWIYRTTSETI